MTPKIRSPEFRKLPYGISLLIYGWLSKLWSLLGSLLKYGTYYLGYPKRYLNFDNYPYGISLFCGALVSSLT